MDSTVSEPSEIIQTKPQMIFNFDTFAFPSSSNSVDHTQFRDKIRWFLQEYAEFVDYKDSGMKIWSTFFIKEQNDDVFPLFVIEESVHDSLNPFCAHCQLAGWGHHFVSKRKYHMIIPARDRWNKPLEAKFSEVRSHILYGLVHCNGFGHLICINGLKEETGLFSESETDVMNFWDRICNHFNIRNISVFDCFKKGSMDLRLLHGLAFGQTRFGRWGYRLKLNSANFGVAKEDVEAATKYLSSLDLYKIIENMKSELKGRRLKKIMKKYRNMSKTSLITVGDLFKVLLGFSFRNVNFSEISGRVIEDDLKTPENCGPVKFSSLAVSLAKKCRWPARRIEQVLMVIVNLLKRNKATNGNGNVGISRHMLREETRKCIGDTGLIDFVLKSISCFTMGNHVIRRSINSLTRRVEFRIHERFSEGEQDGVVCPSIALDSVWPVQTVERAAQQAFEILRSGFRDHPISQLELHNKVRECIGDKKLTDYVLNSLSISKTGSKIVCSSRSASTKRVKVVIQDVLGKGIVKKNGFSSCLENDSGEEVYEDLLFLYRTLLYGYTKSDAINMATEILMDSKHFEKEWLIMETKTDHMMTLICKVLPSFEELETELTRTLSPGVVVEVQSSTTISELKGVVQRALRDTYCIMDKFVVSQIGGLKAIGDDKLLSSTFKHGDLVWVRGYGLDLDTKLRYEGGPPSRI